MEYFTALIKCKIDIEFIFSMKVIDFDFFVK